MTNTEAHSPGPYFARQATGLVRELSAFHSLAFNASFINVGLILIYMFLYVPSFHPGSSMLLACILGTIIAVPMALANAMLASTFPRSGGEYVYNSRVLAPILGFATSFNITIWLLFYVGVSCVLFPKYGLTAVFRYIGIRWGSETFVSAANWCATPTGQFTVGTIVLVAVVVGLIRSTRAMARIQSWYFVAGMIGVALVVLALLGTNKQGYLANFNVYFGGLASDSGAMDSLLAGAKEYGYSTTGFSLLATLVIFFWPASFLFWGNASTYFGGEIKNAKRSQLIAIPGAVVLAGLFVTLAVLAFRAAVGSDTVGAISYLHLCGGGLGFAPTYAELGAVASSSKLLGLLIVLACTYWTIAFVPLCIGCCTRNFLAWSLDRVGPEFLSRVSPRLHTPVPALIVCGIIGEVCVFLHAYVPAFAFMVGIVGAFLTFMATAVSAVVLPFRKKQIFESSSVNWRIGGFPVISIVGVLALLGLLAVQISTLSDPYSGISVSPATDAGYGAGVPFKILLVNIGILAAGFVIYLAAKAIRKAQGIDLSLAFKEIPPE
ncbi:MAG: APC family permease [Candidatus Brocadiae bacterium]|nr:APC family permease [Candidatus Brocadiia bacterium]